MRGIVFTLTLDSSPIKGEGYWLVLSCSPASPCGPVDTALKPVRACATVVASSYSAWRAPAALWFPAYAGMTVRLLRERGYGYVYYRQVMCACSLSVWCMSDQSM